MTGEDKITKLSDNIELKEYPDGEMRIRFLTDDGYYHAVHLLPQEVYDLYEHLNRRFE